MTKKNIIPARCIPLEAEIKETDEAISRLCDNLKYAPLSVIDGYVKNLKALRTSANELRAEMAGLLSQARKE